MTPIDLLNAAARVNLALAAGVLAVIALRGPVVKLAGARVRYGLWLLPPAAMAAVLLPAATIMVPATAPLAIEAVALSAPAEPLSRPFDWTLAAMGLWAAGSLVALGLVLLRQHSFIRRARNGDLGPAVVGLLRPHIHLPMDFQARFSPEEQNLIVAHERVHLARQDARINGLVTLVQCVFWFNPLVHLAAHLSRLDQELACDEAVVARFPHGRKTYAEAMLKTQLTAHALPLGCYWPARSSLPLERRIKMLKIGPKSSVRRLTGALVVVAVTAGAGYAAWATQPPRLIAAPSIRSEQAAPNAPASANLLVAAAAPPKKTPRPAAVTNALSDPPPQPPQPVRPSVITNPDWARRPEPQEYRDYYPARAKIMGVDGRAAISCAVSAEGKLTDCKILAETPADMGFGEAALRIADFFQMKPLTKDGTPVSGGRFQTSINFTTQASPIPPPLPIPPVPPRPSAQNTPPPRPTVITDPDWATRIGDQGAPPPRPGVITARAWASWIGTVTSCGVTEAGTLTNCQAVSRN